MSEAQLTLALAAARSAGQLLLRYFAGSFEVATKSSPIDLVTTADRAAEDLVLATLRPAFPDHSFLAEESGLIGQADQPGPLPPPGGLRWVIDPLDGTTNFAHGFPHFCVSIALCDHLGPLLGVIHDPLRDETFTALRGRGALLLRPNLPDLLLSVSHAADLQRSLVATGFSYQRASSLTNNLPEFCRLVPKVRCVRRAGSAALDLAYVAAGRLDGYWEYHLQPWDIAAGALLVQEAGGSLLDLRGRPYQLGRGDLLAAGPRLLPLLLTELRAAQAEA